MPSARTAPSASQVRLDTVGCERGAQGARPRPGTGETPALRMSAPGSEDEAAIVAAQARQRGGVVHLSAVLEVRAVADSREAMTIAGLAEDGQYRFRGWLRVDWARRQVGTVEAAGG